jgi:hypothetical protein
MIAGGYLHRRGRGQRQPAVLVAAGFLRTAGQGKQTHKDTWKQRGKFPLKKQRE